MNRKTFVILGALTGILAVGTMVFVGKINFVDPRPAMAAAEYFYTELKQGRPDQAFNRYSADFRATNEHVWRPLLFNLQDSHGAVTSATLVETKIVPVSEVGCTLVVYNVARGKLTSKERLILCPDKPSAKIIGHEIIRLDTQQKIKAGPMLHEEVIFHVP